MMKATIYVWLIISALLMLFNAVSHAKVTLVPSVTVREQYNDNIFLTESDKDDDFITNITPRVIFEYHPNKYLDLNLDYRLNFRFYADHRELDDTSLRETQHSDFHAQVRPLNRVYIDIDDTYGRVIQDVREKVATDNQFTNRTERNIFRFSPYIEVPLTTTIFSRIGYRYVDTWYSADEGNDSKSNSFNASLIKKFPSSVTVSLNYDFLTMRPEITNDYDKHEGYISVNYRVVSNLEIWGRIGKAYIDFVDASNDASKYNRTFWGLGSEYKIRGLGDSTLKMTYSKQISESEASVYRNPSELNKEETSTNLRSEKNSISTGVSEIQKFSLLLILRKYVELRVKPRYEIVEEVETSFEDEIKGVDITFSKPLSTKLTAIVDGFWEKQKFLPDDTRVRVYSLGGSFDYIVSRKITAGIGYRYNNRDSNVDGDDYHNNIGWLEARATF